MVDLFEIPATMSSHSLRSLLKSGLDGYIYIVHNDDLAEFVYKSLVVSPAVATELVNRYDGHPKPSMVAKPVENTAMGNFFGTFFTGAKMVPLSERIFSFIKEPICDNKSIDKGHIAVAEKVGKRNKDTYPKNAFSWREGARAKNLQQTRNKITVGIMFLLYITASIWSAEARSYPVSGPQSADVNSFDNPKLLFICGYPCCGFNIHGRCNRCCPKGVVHPSSPSTHVKEDGNG